MNQLPKLVVSALIEKDGKFLLVKEMLESNTPYWIIPGGKVEFGETLEKAVKREIKEETNLDIEVLKLLDFKEAIHTKHNYHTLTFFFLAKPLSEEIVLDKDILESGFFSKEEIRKMNLVESARWVFDNHIR